MAPDGTARCPGGDDDWDADAEMARFLAEVDAGRIPIPSEEELRAPAALYSIGEVADVDPVLLALMAGPDGLAGQAFAQKAAADAMRPGPLLSVLTEQAAQDVTGLCDDELFGMVSAARRLQNRAEYLELAGIAEFTRRRAGQYAASVPAKGRRGPRAGEFADTELAMELLVSDRAAGDRMDLAAALVTRLPRTFAGLADGSVDGGKATAIWFYTRFLSDADAAHADQVLAAAAPELKPDQLARKAAGLEMKLDPEAVRRRKEQARKDGRRVEARRELSGNMSFGGRELSVEEGLAVKAFNDGDAAALRAAGMTGRIGDLRVLAYIDRLTGRNPLDRLAAATREEPDAGDEWDDDSEDGADGGRPGDGPAGAGSPPGGAAPVPALINLLIPAGTLLGWSTAPGDAGTWGLLDGDDTRRIVMAASQHPRTRCCVTAIGADGTALAHAARPGSTRGPPPAANATAPSAAIRPTTDATAPAPGTAPGNPAQTNTSRRSWPTCCASSAPRWLRSLAAPAITAIARTGTPQAASSNTWSAPAPPPARRPAAAARRTTLTWTIRSRGRREQRTNATCLRHADDIIA